MTEGAFFGAGTDLPLCGNGKFVTNLSDIAERWYSTCQQSPGHDGPHVGFIMWDEGEEPSEDETPMTVEQVAEKLGV